MLFLYLAVFAYACLLTRDMPAAIATRAFLHRHRWVVGALVSMYTVLACYQIKVSVAYVYWVVTFLNREDPVRARWIEVVEGLLIEQPRNAYVVARWAAKSTARRVRSLTS